MLNKGFEYRIYPTPDQISLIEKTFGCSRYVYNKALVINEDVYKETGKSPSSVELINLLPSWKKELEWLKETDSIALQQSLRDLDRAYKNFFRNPKHFSKPTFKKKRMRQSYRTGKAEVVDSKHLKLPKLGCVKARISRPFEGRITSATIKKTATGKYFVVLRCGEIKEAPLAKIDEVVGVDVGIEKLITLSNGTIFENPKNIARYEKKLACEQRKLSRKKGSKRGEKRSSNFRKQNLKVARVHERITNSRKDTIHKATSAIVNENQVIAVEDLNVSGMVKNKRLSKAISDASFGEILRQLQYKSEWAGREFVQVDRFFPSSKTCSVCGNIQEMLLDKREYVCLNCATVKGRDVNAACNILTEGLRLLGWDAPKVTLAESR